VSYRASSQPRVDRVIARIVSQTDAAVYPPAVLGLRGQSWMSVGEASFTIEPVPPGIQP
jgi:hypothetical protein